MTTEKRLGKLERELSELRAELGERIKTREVVIVDEKGKDCAGLGMYKVGPGRAGSSSARREREAPRQADPGQGRAGAGPV